MDISDTMTILLLNICHIVRNTAIIRAISEAYRNRFFICCCDGFDHIVVTKLVAFAGILFSPESIRVPYNLHYVRLLYTVYTQYHKDIMANANTDLSADEKKQLTDGLKLVYNVNDEQIKGFVTFMVAHKSEWLNNFKTTEEVKKWVTKSGMTFQEKATDTPAAKAASKSDAYNKYLKWGAIGAAVTAVCVGGFILLKKQTTRQRLRNNV